MVLNASYEYLNIVEDWLDSLTLVLEGKAQPIEHYPEVVRSQPPCMLSRSGAGGSPLTTEYVSTRNGPTIHSA